MRTKMLFLLISGLCWANPSTEAQRHYMEHAEVRHNHGSATVVANDPRPLDQAATALAEEYGWVVDYEDPPFQAAPDLRYGTEIAGGAFESTYEESPSTWTSTQEEQTVLSKAVCDYNGSSNPGRFALRVEGVGRFAIVGTQTRDVNGVGRAVAPILDTRISIPTATQEAGKTIFAIASALSTQTGIKVLFGMGPLNLLHLAQVTVGGNNVSARNLLLQTVAATQSALEWRLLYDPRGKTFYLSLIPAQRAMYGTFDERRLLPVSPRPLTGP